MNFRVGGGKAERTRERAFMDLAFTLATASVTSEGTGGVRSAMRSARLFCPLKSTVAVRVRGRRSRRL